MLMVSLIAGRPEATSAAVVGGSAICRGEGGRVDGFGGIAGNRCALHSQGHQRSALAHSFMGEKHCYETIILLLRIYSVIYIQIQICYCNNN